MRFCASCGLDFEAHDTVRGLNTATSTSQSPTIRGRTLSLVLVAALVLLVGTLGLAWLTSQSSGGDDDALPLAGDSAAPDTEPASVRPASTPALVDADYEITGTFRVYQCDGCGYSNIDFPASGKCVGSGGYADIRPGLQVLVGDETGTLRGVGYLGEGSIFLDFESDALGTGCEFEFAVGSLPPATFYQVGAGQRGTVTFSFEDLQANDWSIMLSLGQ